MIRDNLREVFTKLIARWDLLEPSIGILEFHLAISLDWPIFHPWISGVSNFVYWQLAIVRPRSLQPHIQICRNGHLPYIPQSPDGTEAVTLFPTARYLESRHCHASKTEP